MNMPSHPDHRQQDEPAQQVDIQDADALLLQLSRLVRLVGQIKTRFARRFGQDSTLDTAAYLLLMHLVSGGPQRTTALAEIVHSDTSTVSRQVAGLVRHGLVERRVDAHDGRACLLASTAEGEHLLRRHRDHRTAEIAQLLSSWPRDDVRQLVTLLDRMSTELENYEPHAPGGEPVRDHSGLENNGETR